MAQLHLAGQKSMPTAAGEWMLMPVGFDDQLGIKLVMRKTRAARARRNLGSQQLSDDEAKSAVASVIAAVGATSVKDMGKVMAELKAKFGGQMDFAKAGGIVKSLLG